MKTVKRRTGFLAATVPDSECLNRDGQPIGTEFDEFARRVTPEEANEPLPGGAGWNETPPAKLPDGTDLYPRVTEDGEWRR